MAISYDSVVPWGRSLEEYIDMFALTGEAARGLQSEVVKVDYEFQRGGHSLLRIWR